MAAAACKKRTAAAGRRGAMIADGGTPGWRNGRRSGLKIRGPKKACGFDSHPRHHARSRDLIAIFPRVPRQSFPQGQRSSGRVTSASLPIRRSRVRALEKEPLPECLDVRNASGLARGDESWFSPDWSQRASLARLRGFLHTDPGPGTKGRLNRLGQRPWPIRPLYPTAPFQPASSPRSASATTSASPGSSATGLT